MIKSSVTANAYAVIKGSRDRYQPINQDTGMKDVTEARIMRVLQAKPARLEHDEICVKLKIRVPSAAFDPLMPTAVVVVPDDLTQRGPIEVEAVENV